MYIPTSNVEEIVNAIERQNVPKNKTVLILLAEQKLPDITHLISELNKKKIDFFGAIFPGLIYGAEKYHTGAIIHVLPVIQKPILVQNLSEPTKDLKSCFTAVNQSHKNKPTAFIIVDGLSQKIFSFLSSIYNVFADSVHYLGGGAGTLTFKEQPCIFNPDGFFQDSAIITFIDAKSGLGVQHGWHRIMGPMIVTKSEGNVIKELNWKNAFEVYQEAIETESGRNIDLSNFFEISLNYAFGIYCEGAEDIVRDALKVNEKGELLCAGEVPENAVINILKGEKLSLIKSAEKAVEDSLSAGMINVNHCLVMDCVARSMFLKDDFIEEIRTIIKGFESRNIHVVPEGVLSLGEIASRKEGIIEFFNKTIAIGVFDESTDTVH
ncbi:FIST N-terminal domain-containing protein [uncultured Methanomethylovorans sp.]|uniref:FIST signal transduction protein n=1 Tax=uncultured Methanomethylovorans sp. TaxID=183759 RepID=UPI002AA94F8C|nr:FIST N-terminal domain-containing protein [uncultured Methanomethylovorans sp.]